MWLRSKSKKQVKNAENNSVFPLLDLPALVLESIIRRVSPFWLCQLAQTCRDLRKRCRSDEIWEPLCNKRWGKTAGMNAYVIWKHMHVPKHARVCARPQSLRMGPLKCTGYFSRPKTNLTATDLAIIPDEGFVNLYWQLECGHFWFPGQVFNRERGYNGFMMSCYDADLNYDHNSDTFCARYPPHFVRSLVREDGISWERIRKPPVVASPRELYIPDVPEELKPGDPIEVQWKMSPSFPYGWWYGMVGHSDNCSNENQNCRCHLDEMVWLEFRQYAMGLGWRRFQMRRNRALEVGGELDGFYGGIRKLNNKEDISAWLQMWPKNPLK